MTAQVSVALSAGHYLHWGVINVSLTNLAIVLVMIVVFVAALLVPFPHQEQAQGQAQPPPPQEPRRDAPEVRP